MNRETKETARQMMAHSGVDTLEELTLRNDLTIAGLQLSNGYRELQAEAHPNRDNLEKLRGIINTISATINVIGRMSSYAQIQTARNFDLERINLQLVADNMRLVDENESLKKEAQL